MMNNLSTRPGEAHLLSRLATVPPGTGTSVVVTDPTITTPVHSAVRKRKSRELLPVAATVRIPSPAESIPPDPIILLLTPEDGSQPVILDHLHYYHYTWTERRIPYVPPDHGVVEAAVIARYGILRSTGQGDATITASDLETTRFDEQVTVPMSRHEQRCRTDKRRQMTGRDIIVHRDDQGLQPAALRSAVSPMDGDFDRFNEYRHLYLSQGLDLRTRHGVDVITQVSTWCAYLNNNDDEDIARDIPPPYDIGESYRDMIWEYLRLFYLAGHAALSREDLYAVQVEDLYSYYMGCPIHGYVTNERIPELRIIQRIPLDHVTNELVIRRDISIDFEPDVQRRGGWEIKFNGRNSRDHVTRMRIENAERMSLDPHIYDRVWQPQNSRWMIRYKAKNLKVRNYYVPSWRLPRIPGSEDSYLGDRQLLEKRDTTVLGFPDLTRYRVPAWDNRHPEYRDGAFGKPHNKLYGHVDNPQVAEKLIQPDTSDDEDSSTEEGATPEPTMYPATEYY